MISIPTPYPGTRSIIPFEPFSKFSILTNEAITHISKLFVISRSNPEFAKVIASAALFYKMILIKILKQLF